MQSAKWPARFEILSKDPLIIFDGGHNEAGVIAAVNKDEATKQEQKAIDTLAKALNPGESTACQSSGEGMEGNVHLIAGDSSINYIEKEGPLLSDSHVAFRVFLYIYTFHNFYVV